MHDPEMRHGRKSKATRFDGHKLGVAVDVESQVITAVDVVAGSANDDEGSLELIQQNQQATGLGVEAALGDCAYGTGWNRQRFDEAGIRLLAKVPASRRGEGFGKQEFEIDLDQMTCRCPAGQVTSKLVRHGYERDKAGRMRARRAFQFAAITCTGCPLRHNHAAWRAWHFLYLRPLPHGQGAFRACARSLETGTRAAAAVSGGTAALRSSAN